MRRQSPNANTRSHAHSRAPSLIGTCALAAALLLATACAHRPPAPPTEPDLRLTCGESEAAGKPYRWCLESPARDPEARDVIYFFHGNGGSERSFWENAAYRTLRNRWDVKVKPAVIAFSFGPSWYLGEERGPAGAIDDTLPAREIFPAIEAKLPFPVRHRLIFGESQGGFNAVQIFAKADRTVERVALACPAIAGLDPGAGDNDIASFVARQPGANFETSRAWFRKMADRFPTPQTWDEHDPLKLAANIPATAAELFLVCGTNDPYGFYEPAREFAARVKARGVPTHFESVKNGGHCAEDEASLKDLAEFLEGGTESQRERTLLQAPVKPAR